MDLVWMLAVTIRAEELVLAGMDQVDAWATAQQDIKRA